MTIPPLLSALRPHHWSKNLLVFLPVLAAQRHGDLQAWLDSGVAFLAFCLCASGVYLFNDWIDRVDDRRHPSKRLRGVASERLSAPIALGTAATLPAIAVAMVFFYASPAWPVLAVYVLAAVAYTLLLKKILFVDVITLATLYLLRLVGGAVATGVPLSSWLIALAACVFTTIALAKRLAEVTGVCRGGALERVPGRPYGVNELPRVSRFAAATAGLSMVVLAAYPMSDNARTFYATPWLLWLLAAALGYWLFRLLRLARRGELHLDPIVFAAGDRMTHWLAAGSILVYIVAR